MCQVIHSGIGLWYPQIQFTFRYYDPATNTHIFKSTNVTNFKPAPTAPSPSGSKISYDRRSCKSDQFSILLDPARPDTYHISGKHDGGVELVFTVTRLPNVPGWKLGTGPQGGFTYFGLPTGSKPGSGPKPDSSGGADGYMVHRFWPRCSLTGFIKLPNQESVSLESGRAMFVHAIQGMRPNLIASRWNFCNFQSLPPANGEPDPGVSLTMMEFTTVPGSYYGPAQTITIGSVVANDKLVAVVGSPGAKAVHEGPLTHDPETGYHAPAGLGFEWKGLAIGSSEVMTGAELKLDLQPVTSAGGYTTKGLIEKVDVMAHIPYLVKKLVAAVAGARPYIYTWMNRVEANVEFPSGEGDGTKKITVDGYVFNESTFISDI